MMSPEELLWKKRTFILGVLSLILAVLTFLSAFYFHYDGKRSVENKIVEILSDRYESVDREMSYEEALETLDKDIKRLELENKKVEELELENTNLKIAIEQFNQTERAESYASSGNYGMAISILESIPEKSKDVTLLLNEYIANYESSAIAEAEALANNADFDEALSLIDEALKIVPNSQALKEKKSNITPKYLIDTIECNKAKNLFRLDKKETVTMSGKRYRYAIYSQQTNSVDSLFNNAYSAFAVYNLEGKYSQLSGIIGHIDFSGSGTIGMNDSGQVYDSEITIFGDDTEIGIITLRSSDDAKDFNFPVVGVNKLEFQVKCSGNSKVGIAEIKIR